MTDKTTIMEQVLALTPEDARPLVAQYAPILLEWTVVEIKEWVRLALDNPIAAYRSLLDRAGQDDVMGEFDAAIGAMAGLNISHADKLETVKGAGRGFLSLLIAALMGLVSP